MKDLDPGTPKRPYNRRRKSWEPIWTAMALKQVGVKFQRAKHRTAFYDITFSNGVMRIPRLEIYDSTESFFRNLVAYEQHSKQYILQQVGDYLQVMNCLINTSKDVELLRHYRIIDNRIGNDEKASAMFNQLCSGVGFVREMFLYTQMFDEVNKFCNNPWNKRMTKLKNEYFGSTWALISFMAAALLLLLTALQTVYSPLSYYHP
ncbi:hypothetical protein TIFTF001_033826 [Ficus carica]|uniref:Uncharacterized protein n=1 Tax=Ficus carica TaxID=3494 RepID=A0AA88J832_FICCA|nr:hypothetical protein TIFTF001_033826 [Ficus carica]